MMELFKMFLKGVGDEMLVCIVVNWDWKEIETIEVFKDWKSLIKFWKEAEGIEIEKGIDALDLDDDRVLYIEETIFRGG